jgi:hypothetical protein
VRASVCVTVEIGSTPKLEDIEAACVEAGRRRALQARGSIIERRERSRGPRARRPDTAGPGPSSPGSRAEAGSSQDRADRRGPDPDLQLAELALDPHTSPTWVLPTHSDHGVPEVGVDGRTAGGVLPPVRPLPTNELAVPAEERLGSDQERRPSLARQDPARRGHQDSVEPAKSGPLDPSSQDSFSVS